MQSGNRGRARDGQRAGPLARGIADRAVAEDVVLVVFIHLLLAHPHGVFGGSISRGNGDGKALGIAARPVGGFHGKGVVTRRCRRSADLAVCAERQPIREIAAVKRPCDGRIPRSCKGLIINRPNLSARQSVSCDGGGSGGYTTTCPRYCKFIAVCCSVTIPSYNSICTTCSINQPVNDSTCRSRPNNMSPFTVFFTLNVYPIRRKVKRPCNIIIFIRFKRCILRLSGKLVFSSDRSPRYRKFITIYSSIAIPGNNPICTTCSINQPVNDSTCRSRPNNMSPFTVFFTLNVYPIRRKVKRPCNIIIFIRFKRCILRLSGKLVFSSDRSPRYRKFITIIGIFPKHSCNTKDMANIRIGWRRFAIRSQIRPTVAIFYFQACAIRSSIALPIVVKFYIIPAVSSCRLDCKRSGDGINETKDFRPILVSQRRAICSSYSVDSSICSGCYFIFIIISRAKCKTYIYFLSHCKSIRFIYGMWDVAGINVTHVHMSYHIGRIPRDLCG